MFTKQHYEKIADVLKSWYGDKEKDGKMYYFTHLHMCSDFGHLFFNDNPLRFDYDKFMIACGHIDTDATEILDRS